MKTSSGSRRGFTLIEMLVVIMGMAILLSLLGSLMWAVFQIQAASTDSFERMQRETRLADLFRGDVAQANESLEFSADYQASPLCMILQGEGLIVYRWLEGKLERIEIRKGDSAQQQFMIEGEQARVEFSRQGKLMTMRIHGLKRSQLRIAAALEGVQP